MTGPRTARRTDAAVAAPLPLHSREIASADGTVLATDLCLPPGPGPHPAVLLRTPYDRAAHRAELRGWAGCGFAALAQDVRGRYGSGGRWQPYRHEAADGAATSAWIRQQPWSDGRLVAAGGSYAAYCALTLALYAPVAARPDAVLAAVPALGLAETAREPGGPERLRARAGWWAAHGDRRTGDPDALAEALARDPGLLEHLPLSALPERLGRPLPGWRTLWQQRRTDALLVRARQATVPLLAVGGSHDSFTAETVALWRSWGAGAVPARLLLGPWGHGLTAEPGPDADPAHRLRLGPLYARWARAALAGALTGGRAGAVALGGSPLWLPADDLPAAEQSAAELPGADLPAAELPCARYPFAGTSRLTLLRGAAFTADPARPVRSDDLAVPRQRPADRCLLATGPLTRPLDLLGEAAVELAATADSAHADWAARLVALDPAGRARPLAVGVLRHHGPPGERAELTVPLGRLAVRLPAGARLRLEIAGHHFPDHARNPHTGADPLTATALLPSARRIHPEHSALLLPHRTAGSFAASVDPVQEILR